MKQKAFFLLLLLLAAAAGFLLYRKNLNQVRSFPNANVLLITIDTIRPDRLSCYGSSNQTPNIDAVARQGMLFENAFCQVPLTFPSHTSILTGLFPVHHGVHQNGLETFQKPDLLISDLFRKNGYRTGAVVSSFVLDRRFGLAAGFDLYEDHMERLPAISSNFEVERPGNEACDRAIQMLDSMSGKRWFFWLHFYDPHAPYSPPDPYEGYGGEITFVDNQIGRLSAWLKSRKLDQNLILVIMGDHGESLGEHGEQTHGFFVYNSTLRIPLLLHYPGSPTKTYTDAVSAVDVAPTLLELAGISDPISRDGESIFSVLDHKKRARDIYFESRYPELAGWNGLQGLIRNDWKLIATTRSELYNWRADKMEGTNLYTRNESIARSLKTDLANLGDSSTPRQKPLDSESLEKLRSLGYISTTSVAINPGSADPKDKIAVWAQYEKSLQLQNEKKRKEAQEILESLMSQEPKNNFFRRSLATLYREAGMSGKAIEQLKQSMVQNALDADAYQELAATYKDLKNYSEAMKAVEAAIAVESNRTEFHSLRGILLVETGRFDEAKAEFSQVLKIDPNNAVAWNNLGNAYRETGEMDSALEAYQNAVRLSPHYAFPLNGLATILVRKNRTQEAIPFFEKALELDPNFVEVYLNLGIAYHTLHQTEKAKTLYRTFLKLAPPSMQRDRENAKLLLVQIS